MPLIEVSNGEIVDKYTILKLKFKNMSNGDALRNIEREIFGIRQKVESLIKNSIEVSDLTYRLQKINKELWKVEDELREHERLKKFDDEFIQLARSVYKLNDARAGIKREINMLTKSEIVEEKSYEQY